MGEMTRRGMLIAGGAVGACGALGVAHPAWSWSPRLSLAGAGEGSDPRWVWDDVADPLVADIIERGDVERANAALRAWRRNGDPLPEDMPGDLRAFIEDARRLPSWVDHAKLAAGADFNQKRGLYLGALYGLGSGMMSTVIPREARAVYYSEGGADMKDRIAKTSKLGYDVGSLDAFAPTGEMVVTAVKTRLVHAAVRHLLPQSPYWSAVSDEEIPISQRDIMVTWHSLASFSMGKLDEWDIESPAEERDGFLHTWQLAAHLLGVRSEYIPATWDAAYAQRAQVLDPLLAPTLEGVELADELLSLATAYDGGASRPFLGAMTRYLLGHEIADRLEIRRAPFWETFIATGWPPFVRFREALLPLPLAPAGYWMFDEFLRQGALFFLSEGRPISIEIPDDNNPNH